jgi:HK97 gp10 family phage protein
MANYNWRTDAYTRNGVTGLNGRCVAQLKEIQNVGHIMALPAAQYVAKQARGYAHVITGYMRDHTVAKKVSDTQADVVSTAPYAEFEEFGTRFRPPHPFIRPAMADAAIHLPQMSAKEVNAEIRRRVQKA